MNVEVLEVERVRLEKRKIASRRRKPRRAASTGGLQTSDEGGEHG